MNRALVICIISGLGAMIGIETSLYLVELYRARKRIIDPGSK